MVTVVTCVEVSLPDLVAQPQQGAGVGDVEGEADVEEGGEEEEGGEQRRGRTREHLEDRSTQGAVSIKKKERI